MGFHFTILLRIVRWSLTTEELIFQITHLSGRCLEELEMTRPTIKAERFHTFDHLCENDTKILVLFSLFGALVWSANCMLAMKTICFAMFVKNEVTERKCIIDASNTSQLQAPKSKTYEAKISLKASIDPKNCVRTNLKKSRFVNTGSFWKENLVLSNELIKVKLLAWKVWKADGSSLSTNLMQPNFHVPHSHRRSTTISWETRNFFLV